MAKKTAPLTDSALIQNAVDSINAISMERVELQTRFNPQFSKVVARLLNIDKMMEKAKKSGSTAEQRKEKKEKREAAQIVVIADKINYAKAELAAIENCTTLKDITAAKKKLKETWKGF